MLPPIRKASSDLENKSKSTFDIPKSGSFSHFTSTATTMKPSEQLIKKYCLGKDDSSKNPNIPLIRPCSTPPDSSGLVSKEDRDQERRPESSPPVLFSSQNIFIPVNDGDRRDSNTNDDSSPLDHYVHTDGKLGIIKSCGSKSVYLKHLCQKNIHIYFRTLYLFVVFFVNLCSIL